MAEKKKTSNKKSPSKKKGANKTKYVGKNKNLNETFFDRNRNSIMLGYFIVGILLFCIAFIPGYNVWEKIRAAFFSFFGWSFYLIVVEVVVIAVRMMLKNLKRSFIITNISALLLVSTFSSIVHLFVFSVNEGDGFKQWADQFMEAMKAGWAIGLGDFSATGGILGALFGGTPLHLFGKAASMVLAVLIFLVSLFFYLDIDSNILGEKLSDAVIKSRDKIGENKLLRKEKTEEKKRLRNEEKLAKMQQEIEDLEEEKYRAILSEEEENSENGSDDGIIRISFEDEQSEKEENEVKKEKASFLGAFRSSDKNKKEKQEEKSKDDFDFNKTEIEIESSKDGRDYYRPLKQYVPEDNVFSFSKAKATAETTSAGTGFKDDFISTGHSAGKDNISAASAPLKNSSEDFEEIGGDDDFDELPSSASKEKINLSDNDKAVVSEAVKDANIKLEKNKAEVKNYKETRKPKRAYVLPKINLLNEPSFGSQLDSETEMRQTAKKLVEILKSFGVETKLIGASRGPSVTRYELSPAPGVKISKITSLADDIALGLASTDVRIEAPIPNKAAVGIEVPNKKSSMVTLREVISSKEYKDNQDKLLTVALGKDIAGNIRCADLAKMPHLLIAGTTGSGKSVCLNCMITSVLYNATPEQVKLLMIDPKQVEFSVYNGIPHLLVPVITDARKAAGSLAWAVGEMDSRYKTFSTCGVRDIKSYNAYIKEHPELPFMPQIVIFIDELNDLMMVSPKEVEDSICRLAQKARAAGMHLVVATQRPSVDVITGIIKANIPSRLSLSVSSQVDSRTILDSVGAEKLLGNGDMLFNPVGVSKPVRIQGAYLSDGEIEKIVTFIKAQSSVSYDDVIMQEIERNAVADNKKKGSSAPEGEDSQLDSLIEEAMNIVTQLNSASTTVIQRKLSVGYARAARIMDQLEQLGYISPAEGNKPRKVLITRAQFLETRAKGEAVSDDYDVLSD